MVGECVKKQHSGILSEMEYWNSFYYSKRALARKENWLNLPSFLPLEKQRVAENLPNFLESEVCKIQKNRPRIIWHFPFLSLFSRLNILLDTFSGLSWLAFGPVKDYFHSIFRASSFLQDIFCQIFWWMNIFWI